MWRVTGGGTWQLAQVEPNGYMGSNGYVGVSWGATDIYTRNGQPSGTGYGSRFVGQLRPHTHVDPLARHPASFKKGLI